MSQISPPIRILLVCAVAFMAAWMLFLRPSADAGDPATEAPIPAANAGGPDANSAAGKIVEKANEATAAQDAQAAAAADGTAEETTAPGVTPTTEAPANAPADAAAADPGKLSKQATGGLPQRVTRAIGDHKVVVLLFWSPKAAEDKAVRKALTGIDRHDGKVLAHATHIKRIAAYQQITRGAQVEQSPTVVVVDRRREVRTLVGYVDRTSIDQAVADALRTQQR
jgi:hypothetical protein